MRCRYFSKTAQLNLGGNLLIIADGFLKMPSNLNTAHLHPLFNFTPSSRAETAKMFEWGWQQAVANAVRISVVVVC